MDLIVTQVVHKRYRLIRGSGESGGLQPAWDLHRDQRVSLKYFSKLPAEQAAPGLAPWMELLPSLAHPHLARIVDAFVADGCACVVLDAAEGKNLAQMIEQRGGSLPEDRIVAWVRQLGRAVEYLHRQVPAVCGLGLRPEGVWIAPNGWAVFYDLDFAALHGLRGDAVEDVTALGRLLQYGVSRDEPASMPARRDETGAARLSADLGPALDRGEELDLAAVAARSLDPDPARRYASVHELMNALRHAPAERYAIVIAPHRRTEFAPLEQAGLPRLETIPPETSHPEPESRQQRWRHARHAMLRMLAPVERRAPILAAALLLVVITTVALFSQRRTPQAAVLQPTPVAAAALLSLDRPATGLQPAESVAQITPTPEAVLPTPIEELSPTPVEIALQPFSTAPPPALLDWKELFFLPVITGCPEPDAVCMRNNTNRGQISSDGYYYATLTLPTPVLIDAGWRNPTLVFWYRGSAVRRSLSQDITINDISPPVLNIRSADFDILEQVELSIPGDEWLTAAIPLNVHQGQEVLIQFEVGRYWGLLFINDIRIEPDPSALP